MRVLVIPTPVPTHFMPLVPLAWALRAAGHEVTVLGQPDVYGAVRAAGLTAQCVGEEFDVNGMLLRGLPEDHRPLQARPRPAPELTGGYGRVWHANATSLLDHCREHAREFRPDLVLADPLEYCSLIVGGLLGVPVVHHRWGVDAISEPARRAVRPDFQGLCESLGLSGLPDPSVILDPCPPSLQLPGVEKGEPIRFVPYGGGGKVPAWLREDRATGRPRGLRRVLVTLGSSTLALHGVPFARGLLGALGRSPGVEVLATVGEPYRSRIGALPGQVRLIDPLPLHLFLDTCDAVVHHGGAGTAMTATAFGLPQLVLPQLADQFWLADRLTATGAGLGLETAAEQDDPDLVRDALDELLTHPGYGTAARALAAELNGMPPPARVAADLEDLVAEAATAAKTPCASRR